MKRLILIAPILIAGTLAIAGCASTSEVATLQARVKTLEAENNLAKLKLADEMERADIQMFLTRQEIGAAKREAAAVRAKCGAACN
jgi:outer membrane murein-binding lipoprotein Lpp